LARLLDRHGAQHVVLLVRGRSPKARATQPRWSTGHHRRGFEGVGFLPGMGEPRGLAWIEAFDHVPLMALLQTMVDLELFRPSTIGHYLFLALRNRLRKVFEPPKVKPPRKVQKIRR
jgi:hypothetical protein